MPRSAVRVGDAAGPGRGGRKSTDRERVEQLGVQLERLKTSAAEDMARLEFLADNLESGIRSIRLLPLSTIFNLFPRMVRDLAREQRKEVSFLIEGGDIAADKRVIEEIKDPLMHMLRNAVDHGIEEPEERAGRGKPRTAVLRLRALRTANNIVIEIEDDGRGIDVESIRRTALKRRVRSEEELATMTAAEIRELIFAPGFSTRSVVTDVSGRGVGLDVVRAKTDLLKGTLAVESEAGQGCRMRLYLPLTLATSRVLIVAASDQKFALPLEYVDTARLVSAKEIFPIKGRPAILVDGAPLTVAPLVTLLGLTRPQQEERRPDSALAADRPSPCIILAVGKDRLGVLVDALIDEQEIVVKQLGALLKRVPNVAGATILGSGEVCMVLNAADLLKSARKQLSYGGTAVKREEAPRASVVLLVEDSLTTRTQEKRILEGAGYEVVTAVDGLDGYNKLRSREFDAVVSDVEMPNMDGLTLAAKIREDPSYGELPIILITSLGSDESRRKGMEAGASAYLVKSTFDQAVLLETLRRLL
jgi:two-component system chemotaxis sensor kinase CheA